MSKRKKLLAAAATGLAALLLLWGLGAGDVIDLPEWANIPGVDVPLVGDMDAIDCKLRQLDDSRDVRITIVDGDKETYASYVNVWNNGNLVDLDQIQRPLDEVLLVPSDPTKDEQFYSISIEPVQEGRVYCESIVLE